MEKRKSKPQPDSAKTTCNCCEYDEQSLQEFYNNLYETPEQQAQENEYQIRTSNDVKLIQSKIEKINYQIYKTRIDKTTQENIKKEKLNQLQKELEFFERRLDELQNK